MLTTKEQAKEMLEKEISSAVDYDYELIERQGEYEEHRGHHLHFDFILQGKKYDLSLYVDDKGNSKICYPEDNYQDFGGGRQGEANLWRYLYFIERYGY